MNCGRIDLAYKIEDLYCGNDMPQIDVEITPAVDDSPKASNFVMPNADVNNATVASTSSAGNQDSAAFSENQMNADIPKSVTFQHTLVVDGKTENTGMQNRSASGYNSVMRNSLKSEDSVLTEIPENQASVHESMPATPEVTGVLEDSFDVPENQKEENEGNVARRRRLESVGAPTINSLANAKTRDDLDVLTDTDFNSPTSSAAIDLLSLDFVDSTASQDVDNPAFIRETAKIGDDQAEDVNWPDTSSIISSVTQELKMAAPEPTASGQDSLQNNQSPFQEMDKLGAESDMASKQASGSLQDGNRIASSTMHQSENPQGTTSDKENKEEQKTTNQLESKLSATTSSEENVDFAGDLSDAQSDDSRGEQTVEASKEVLESETRPARNSDV